MTQMEMFIQITEDIRLIAWHVKEITKGREAQCELLSVMAACDERRKACLVEQKKEA